MHIETIEDIENVVAKITEAHGDAEVAHSLEDDLYESVLRRIADGPKGTAKELAYAALATKELDFPRWCA